MTKSILIIGLGRFGAHLCRNLAELGNEIMIVDNNEEHLQDLIPIVTSAKVADCTNPEVLKNIGVSNFDYVVVSIGTNFQSSLEITNLAKELGAKYVISKANRDIHAKFLLKNGADEVIYPDRDIAERIAMKLTANHIFDYIELTDEYGVYEIDPLPEWTGKTIRELDFAAKYHMSIIGFKNKHDTEILPHPDRVFVENEHLMVLGRGSEVEELLKKLK